MNNSIQPDASDPILDEADRLNKQEENFESSINLWTIDEILSHPFPDQDWLIERLLPKNAITIVAGAPTAGKTWLILEMAKSVASNTTFLNRFKTEGGAVLFVSEEDHINFLQKRFKQLKFVPGIPFYALIEQGFKINDDKWLGYVLRIIKEKNIKLLILDSFRATHDKKESDSTEMNDLFHRLKKIAKVGVSILMSHHTRKGGSDAESPEDMRGSSDIFAKIDCLLGVAKDGQTINIIQHKIKMAEELQAFAVALSFEGEGKYLRMEYKGAKRDRVTEAVFQVLAKAELSIDDVIKEIRVGDNADLTPNLIKSKLRILLEAGLLNVRTAARNKKFYSLIIV